MMDNFDTIVLCNVQMRDVIPVVKLLMLVAMVTADVTDNLRHRRSDVIDDGE